MRRWAGMSPVYADGILVCPTYSGAIVGYDLATRSFLWGYRYTEKANESMMKMGYRPQYGDRVGGGIVAIGQRRVMLTPVDSPSLYCLDLLDGKLLWTCPRQPDDLYVACVTGDKVVVVDRSAVRAIQLTDGKPAWDGRLVNFPDGGRPSGVGLLADNDYLVPLGNGDIVTLDISAGNIVRLSKTRYGGLPGNLVCHQGTLISAGVEGVDCYWLMDAAQAEAQRRMAANPDDAQAVALEGELLLEAGKRSEAIASFRRAYQLQPRQRTRNLLRNALLEGLKEEFAAYRGHGDEIQGLLDNASERTAFCA